MAIVERKDRNGRTVYLVRVLDPFRKWYPAQSFLEEHEAKAYEAALLKRKRQGALTITQDARTVTMDEFWEVWSEENRNKVGDGWKISQDQMYRDYISPVLGSIRMIQIQEPQIGRVLNRMRTAKQMPDGKARSEQTIKHVYSLLRKIFGDAVGYYKMLTDCPVNAKFHRPEVAEKESEFLTPAQAWQLLERSRDRWYGPAVWLELLAGLRTEATVALLWEAVSWETDQILICRAYKKKVRRFEDFPKGKKWEYVPMSPPLKEYLWELWQKCGDPKAYVSPGPKGDRHMAPETFEENLKKVCVELGLPRLSPHKLRHSCSELFVREGASEEDIKRLLNHKQSSTTRRYMHRTDDRLRAIASRITGAGLRVVEGGSDPKCFTESFTTVKQSTYVVPRKGVVRES